MTLTIDDIISKINATYTDVSELGAERDAHLARLTAVNGGVPPIQRSKLGVWLAPKSGYKDIDEKGHVIKRAHRMNETLQSHTRFSLLYGAHKRVSTDGSGFNRMKLTRGDYLTLLDASSQWPDIGFRAGQEWVEAGLRTQYIYAYADKPQFIKLLNAICDEKQLTQWPKEHKGMPLNKAVTVNAYVLNCFSEYGALDEAFKPTRMTLRLDNHIKCVSTFPDTIEPIKQGDTITLTARFRLARENINIDAYLDEMCEDKEERDQVLRVSSVELEAFKLENVAILGKESSELARR